MRRFIPENALSLVLFGLFLVSAIGQALTGWHANLEELRQHAEPSIAFADYLRSGHYISAVFENWESEFLQMGAYVLLTVFLRQKGSPESKPVAAVLLQGLQRLADRVEGPDWRRQEHIGDGKAGASVQGPALHV
jgi:hypothetical protein